MIYYASDNTAGGCCAARDCLRSGTGGRAGGPRPGTKRGMEMRILGIDYGDARTGLSVSDPSGFLAGSPSVIHEWNYDKLVDKLVAFVSENRIEEIVLGWPKNMDGTAGPRAEKCEALAETLRARTGLPVVLWDERRTTAAAHEILHQSGKKMKKHRQTVDAVAAALILQGYLDYRRSRA